MASVTLTDLHELPDEHLQQLVGLMAHERNTTAAAFPRLAAVCMVLYDGLIDEQQRRRENTLPHSAVTVTLPLQTAGELNDIEMERLMRLMLNGRTRAAGGGPAAARIFDAMLAALQDARTRQGQTLARMDRDLCNRGEQGGEQ